MIEWKPIDELPTNFEEGQLLLVWFGGEPYLAFRYLGDWWDARGVLLTKSKRWDGRRRSTKERIKYFAMIQSPTRNRRSMALTDPLNPPSAALPAPSPAR